MARQVTLKLGSNPSLGKLEHAWIPRLDDPILCDVEHKVLTVGVEWHEYKTQDEYVIKDREGGPRKGLLGSGRNWKAGESALLTSKKLDGESADARIRELLDLGDS